MILAGDIGGTSTRLGVFKVAGGRLAPLIEQTFPSLKYAGLGEIAAAFMAEHEVKIDRACFGIAGPVQHGRVVTPNLAWVVDSVPLARGLGLRTVRLINDLEANAYGIAVLAAGDFVTLNEGAPGAAGNCAVISVGTGLGEAGMYWDGQTHHPFACEGGHADFAPRDELEAEFLHYLRAKFTEFGHVSYERVLSGPGLREVYEFLRDVKGGREPAWLREAMLAGDPSAAISNAGLEGRCELCARALDMFVSFYGAEAGNLALKTMAIGGLYVGGGIAPRIIGKLQGPLFMAAFAAKGRMRPLMEAMPVRVIMKETTALLGAARAAMLTA
ncbi:MAG TPA: glucokinase [Dongiaceae bacterium]|nr:glucokinase [Dongiaceae bacterium]